MKPKEFLAEVVHPNVAAFHEDFTNLRQAFNAVASVDALTAHLFVWCTANAPSEVAGVKDDTIYRYKLAGRCTDVGLLCDIAKTQNHVHIGRGNPLITQEHQITSRPIGFGEGGFG